MAFQEITVTEEEIGPPANYVRFSAIGDKFAGRYVGFKEETRTFDDQKKTQRNYTFRNKDGLHVITANKDLHARLQKAKLEPGHKVIITFIATIPTGGEGRSPMKQFKLLVERDAGPPKPPPPADDFE